MLDLNRQSNPSGMGAAKKSLNRLRKKLGGLYEMGEHTERTEGRLRAAARDRLEVVNAELEKLQARAITDPAAAERYETFILERGRLHQVLAR